MITHKAAKIGGLVFHKLLKLSVTVMYNPLDERRQHVRFYS